LTSDVIVYDKQKLLQCIAHVGYMHCIILFYFSVFNLVDDDSFLYAKVILKLNKKQTETETISYPRVNKSNSGVHRPKLLFY